MNRKLLLLMPPQNHLMAGFATGLVSISLYLQSKIPSLKVEIKDFSAKTLLEVEEWLKTSHKKNNNAQLFLGITTTTASYQSALIVAKSAKTISPEIVTVLGGAHASADYKTVIRHHSSTIDFVVTGEGEKSLFQLVQSYPSLEAVKGIAYVNKDNEVQVNHAPTPLTQQELDDIPADIPDLSKSTAMGKFEHITYVSARGCPLKCSFCAVANQTIRSKSIAILKQDVQRILEAGYRTIAIEDNFFAHSLNRTRQICKALYDLKWETGIEFKWDCQTRVESLVRQEVISEMDRAGCHAVYIGVESLIPHRLLSLNKTSHPQKYLSKLKEIVIPSILASNIDCHINLQVGFPDETVSDKEQTLKELRELGNIAAKAGKKITVFPQLHVVYPGTGDFSEGLKNGIYKEDQFETFTKWEEKQEPVLKWLGEHFAHGTGGLPVGILNLEKLQRDCYEVRSDSVLLISNTLRAFDEIDGIELFRYGKHLTSNFNNGKMQ